MRAVTMAAVGLAALALWPAAAGAQERPAGGWYDTMLWPLDAARGWDSALVGAERKLAEEELLRFRDGVENDLSELAGLIDAAGWKLSQVSMGTGLLPEISLSVDFVRQLNAGERAAPDAKLAQAGRIENGVVEILLDAAQSPFATRTDGFRLSGLEIEVGVLPEVTWLLANDG